MLISGGMQYKILFERILERFVGGMKGMKGCTCTRYLRWRRSCQHLNMNLWLSF